MACPNCGRESQPQRYVCPECGEERFAGAQLIGALTYSDGPASFRLSLKLIPPVLIALAAVIGKCAQLPELLYVGIAGAIAFLLIGRARRPSPK